MSTTLILIIFILGYVAITLEHTLKVNKAASALITGVVCWTVYCLSNASVDSVVHQLYEHLGEVSGILFFLLGAMVIVELVDAHDGFEVITERITTTSKRKLLWILSTTTFFLSAVLDNLTTTIVMLSLQRKLLTDRDDRLFLAGLTVVAANAGGAWSPLGDVTTTMLWIGGQVTALNTVTSLFLPSVVCIALPVLAVTFLVSGHITPPSFDHAARSNTPSAERNLVFLLGLGALLFVPVFKTVTHLPPFMGMLLALGLLWVVTEIIHSGKDDAEKGVLSVNHAIRKIDTPSVLFFLGILLAVATLQSTGVLASFAYTLDQRVGNLTAIGLFIGLVSAVVDNVPLVAAAQAMYPLERFPTDHFFWQLLAYSAGTGGSALIVGSAAGVAAMGLEKIDFFWYLKRVSLLALVGYSAGAGTYLVQRWFWW
jgi:Na+/H+ antiporter NhaD/arsenite permease-like protein